MADMLHVFKSGFAADKAVEVTPEILHTLQKTVLEIFKDFSRVAEKYQIQYVLGGGSALGAVRHGGFIPWDDDIDLNMPRADFDRFKELFDRELGDRYMLCAPELTSRHGILCSQIKKRGTVSRSYNELNKPEELCGICIDIFVIENTCDNAVLRKLQGYVSLAAGYMVTCRKTYEDISVLRNYLMKGSLAAQKMEKKARIGRWFAWLSLDRTVKLGNAVYRMCGNPHSKFVTVPTGRKHFFGELYPREMFAVRKQCAFEDTMAWIPEDIDGYMKGLYGDNYMKVPPVEKQETHPIMELKF